MRKVWTIACREYGAMVATKAFLISLALMPVLMFGGVFFATKLKDVGQPTAKRIIVVDGTGGKLFGDLLGAAVTHNVGVGIAGEAAGTKYLLERYPEDSIDDETRLALSDRVRKEELAAFVEVPAGSANEGDATENAGAKGDKPATDARVLFYAQNPMISRERAWVQEVLSAATTQRRLKALDLDPAVIRQATAEVPVVGLGLVKRAADGGIKGAGEGQGVAAMIAPFGMTMLLFMVVMLSAQPMLEGVMEEKTGRVAELLLGSVNSFQLMLGKLLGNIAGSLSVVGIYAAGAYAMCVYRGWTQFVPLGVLPWFVVFQVLAVLLFGSLFLAVGASVTQLKEAQTTLLPVWLLMCIPLWAWLPIVSQPNGPVATWLSFFPPAAPMTMVLRLSSEATIPLWQTVLSALLLLAAALLCTFFAGRIFRIGILWQGKTPKLAELVRWGLTG